MVSKDYILSNALIYNSFYKSSVQDEEVKFYRYLSYYSDFLPKVSVGYKASNSRFRGELAISKDYSLNLDYNIFNGFRSYNALNIAYKNYKQTSIEREYALANLIKDVNIAYQSVLKAIYLKEAAESLYQGAVIVLLEAEEKVALDVMTKVELYKAMADKEKAYSDLLNAETVYESAIIELEDLAGLPLGRDTIFLELDNSYQLNTLDDYLSVALNNNAEIKKYLNNIDISSSERNSNFGSFLPVVDLSLSSSWSQKNRANSNSIAISIGWNIFSGLHDTANSIASAKNVDVNRLLYVNTKNQVIKQVKTLWLQYESNIKKVDSAYLYVRSAEENYNATVEMFKLGRSSLKDTIDARSTLYDAKTTLADAILSKVKIYYELVVVSGLQLDQYYLDNTSNH